MLNLHFTLSGFCAFWMQPLAGVLIISLSEQEVAASTLSFALPSMLYSLAAHASCRLTSSSTPLLAFLPTKKPVISSALHSRIHSASMPVPMSINVKSTKAAIGSADVHHLTIEV